MNENPKQRGLSKKVLPSSRQKIHQVLLPPPQPPAHKLDMSLTVLFLHPLIGSCKTAST